MNLKSENNKLAKLNQMLKMNLEGGFDLSVSADGFDTFMTKKN